jgi:aspartate-semialdehyde dehydrogenase
VQKIAIVGASSLLGKELKELLLDSPLSGAELILFDDEEVMGQLEQIGDEVTFIGRVTPESFEGVDFAFFTGTRALTELHWKQAVRSNCPVIDLSGTLDAEENVLISAPWLVGNKSGADLLTTAIVAADPAALVLALLMERLAKAAPVRFAAATVMQPASELGSAAMDELHQQTVNLLSFQTLPRAVFDAQVAYNILSGFGEGAVTPLADCAERVRRHYHRLAGAESQMVIQLLQAPIFHGHCFSIACEFAHAIDLSSIEQALSGEHIDLVLEDTDSPSNLAATGQNDLLVRLRPEGVTGTIHIAGSSPVTRLWLWVATDNLRLNAANAIECALELDKVRPRGKVQ